jgi:hypothetical protein
LAVTDLACTMDRSPEAVSGHESPARDFASGDCAAGRTCVETGRVFVRSATLCTDIWRHDLERHGATTAARVRPIFFRRRQRWTSRGIRKFHRVYKSLRILWDRSTCSMAIPPKLCLTKMIGRHLVPFSFHIIEFSPGKNFDAQYTLLLFTCGPVR